MSQPSHTYERANPYRVPPHFGRLMNIRRSVLGSVGATPLIKLNRIAEGVDATIALKCEFFNPLGSVKDRIGLAMIEAAEASGRLTPRTLIVEPSSGNTGIALAFIAATRGYRLVVTMPESTSTERRMLLSLLGAELELTPAAEGMAGAVRRAYEITEHHRDSWIPMQFENPANPEIHRQTTAEEIWSETGGNIDIFISGVGTGGTITGVSEVIKERRPELQSIAVEPSASPVILQTITGQPVKAGRHAIQGIGAGFVPKNLNLAILDEVIGVTDEQAIDTARRIARLEGLLVGLSTGANVYAALEVANRPENRGKLIVTVGCSTGERYLSTELFQHGVETRL